VPVPALARRDVRSGPSGHLSSADVIASVPPVPHVAATLTLEGQVVDLSTRVLVAGVVPSPRFGREGEVVATATATVDRGADLVDISLPPRLVGPASRVATVPVTARVASLDDARAAARAGVSVVLVPLALLSDDRADTDMAGTVAVVLPLVDQVADVPEARSQAERRGTAVAFDSSALSSAAAIGCEAAAIAEGCRLLRTGDVRRSRRVAEVMAAILAARRPAAVRAAPDGAPASEDPGSQA